MDKCREEFEKYLDDNKMFMNINRVFNQSSNEYEYCAIQWIWASWQHQQAKVEELQDKLIDQGLICPFCGISELKEDIFLNGEIECLISVCTECGIETASKMQMKVNKLVNLNGELQKRVDAVVVELDKQIECSVSSFTQRLLVELKQALKGEV